MPYTVRCKACSASFAIPDEIWDKRVRGRVAALKCRTCKAEIQVDGTKEGVSQPSAAPPARSVAPSAGATSAEPGAGLQAGSSSAPAAAPGAPALANDKNGAAESSPSASSPQTRPLVSSGANPEPGSATHAATKPLAKAAKEVVAADVGWSLMPPPGDLDAVGLSSKPGLTEIRRDAEPVQGASKLPTAKAAQPAGTGPIAATENELNPKTAKLTTAVVQPSATTTKAATAPAATAPAAPSTTTAKTATAPVASSATTAKAETAPGASSTIATNASATSGSTSGSTHGAPSVPPLSVPPELLEASAPDPDLWVVSYGEDDDRELTEQQIAAELQKGNITLSTIVWQDGMPEWLPISGLKALAKYAPELRPAPARATKTAKTSALAKSGTSTATAATSSATTTTAATKPGSTVPRQPASPRTKLSSSNDVGQKPSARTTEPDATSTAATPDPATAPTVVDSKAGKGPPPLRTADGRGAEKPPSPGSRVPVPRSAEPTDTLGAGSSHAAGGPALRPGSRVPPLPRHSQARPEPASPWTQEELVPDESGDDVITSAPVVGTPLPVEPPAPELPATPLQQPVVAGVIPTRAGGTPAFPTAPAAPATEKSPAKASLRPPKPVETATSLVSRTEGAQNKDLLITDDDFLAMQRRFPKWALPAAIVGGLILVGLVVFAATSGEEPPPLPVAPVMPTSATLRDNPANQAQPRHPQPNLDALPAAAAAKSDEKDFATLFAQSATKTNGTFDAKAAQATANGVMALAGRCRVAPDPGGPARAVVTFATAGHVGGVQLGIPHNGTATGKCIDKVLRTIKVRPFQGEPGRLPLTVPIQ